MVSLDSSPYDAIAEMYDSLWADWYLPAALPALEQLFFGRIPAAASVLDLCCGCGHTTQELVRRGYRVTGIDISSALIAIARERLPKTDLQVQDARHFHYKQRFQGVLSTFDSLNHLLTIEDLKLVFSCVNGALRPNGYFVFDMNLEEAYAPGSWQWSVDVKDRSVSLVRAGYDFATHTATTELLWFASGPAGCWRQSRSVVTQRCYAKAEIILALQAAGFRDIRATAAEEAGVTSDIGFGRWFFSARG